MEKNMISLNEILDMPNRREAFYMITDYYKSASDSERENIRKSWDFHRKWIFPDQETLAIVLPGEKSCQERIRASLIHSSIECEKNSYYRETMIEFCVLYHSAKEIGLDPKKLFEEVAEISSPEFATRLKQFSGRTEESLALEHFACKRIVESDGKVFIKWDW